MDHELRFLDVALKNCRYVEKSISYSIKLVRRLNIRYNTDWLMQNYKSYLAGIFAQHRCRTVDIVLQRKLNEKLATAAAVSGRSSRELCGSNRRINYKVLKIKRNMEALLNQVQRTIKISRRQLHYAHVTFGEKMRICCH